MSHAAAAGVPLRRVALGDVLRVVGLAAVHLVIRLTLQLLWRDKGGGVTGCTGRARSSQAMGNIPASDLSGSCMYW